MSDSEEQNDEICVLESIYTPEELQIERDENGKIHGKFFALVTVPEKFHITYKMVELDQPRDQIPSNSVDVSYLPPIILSFTLPVDYPSKSIPEYHISCSWLKFTRLRELSRKLEFLWNENNNVVILYIWTQFLKEETLSYLNIGDSLDVTGFYINELRKKKKVPICTNASPSGKCLPPRRLSSRKSAVREKPVEDVNFSVISIPNMHLHQFLKAYSEDRVKTEFLRGVYSCEICFTEKVGAKCIKFVPCDHVYCKDCLKSFFEVRIKDGSIHTMPCPHDKCTSEALQSQGTEDGLLRLKALCF